MVKKNLILITVTIITSATAAALIWYFIFRPAQAPTQQPAGTTLPEQIQSKVKQISSTPTLWANISGSQNKIFWYDQDGQLWSSGSDGNSAKSTTRAPVQNFIKSIWSPDGSKNVISIGTSQKDIRFVSLFSESAVSTFLPNNVKTASFSPDGKRIIYQVIDDSKNQNTLFISDPDGKKSSTVATLRLRDVIVGWPQANLVSFVSKPSGLVGGSLWVLNLKTLVFDKLIDNLNGLEVLWSPDGTKILFSSTDQNAQNPRLSVMDLNGNAKDLGISTIVSKCAWASNSRDIYCAAGRWPGDAVLPDDYYKDAFSVVDDIVKINVDSGRKDAVISPVFDAVNLVVSQNQDFLLFITKNTSRLYRLDLK